MTHKIKPEEFSPHFNDFRGFVSATFGGSLDDVSNKVGVSLLFAYYHHWLRDNIRLRLAPIEESLERADPRFWMTRRFKVGDHVRSFHRNKVHPAVFEILLFDPVVLIVKWVDGNEDDKNVTNLAYQDWGWELVERQKKEKL